MPSPGVQDVLAARSPDTARRSLLSPWRFRLYLWRRLPLAACAGLRVVQLDEQCCRVLLPGGWRTRNPFGSTYFAAQAMAAELSTGAAAFVAVQGSPASLSMLVLGLKATFARRIVGESLFTFADVRGMDEAIARAAAGPGAERFQAHSIGRAGDGSVAAEFEVAWSFKRRG